VHLILSILLNGTGAFFVFQLALERCAFGAFSEFQLALE